MANHNQKAPTKKPAGAMSAKEIELQKKVRDLEAAFKKSQDDLAEASKVSEVKANSVDVQQVSNPELENLKAQVELLSNQILKQQSQIDPSKHKYRPVPADDWQDESVTFSARKVFLIVGSYLNGKGQEILPPYKLIKMQYAASDIRKDGREDQIVNYCTFSTNLKAEIEHLRDHPLYGIEFYENLNATMSNDSKFSEFRVRAAQQIASMSDDGILAMANEYRIANLTTLSVRELRTILVAHLGDRYIKSAKELNDELAKKRLLTSQDS